MLCLLFSLFWGRHSSQHSGVLARYLGILARYLGVPTRSPLTTISSWLDKGMVAFLGGVSDMSFKNFTSDWALASGCLLKKLVHSDYIWICLLHVIKNASDCASAF